MAFGHITALGRMHIMAFGHIMAKVWRAQERQRMCQHRKRQRRKKETRKKVKVTKNMCDHAK